jgi:hypothetical protein
MQYGTWICTKRRWVTIKRHVLADSLLKQEIPDSFLRGGRWSRTWKSEPPSNILEILPIVRRHIYRKHLPDDFDSKGRGEVKAILWVMIEIHLSIEINWFSHSRDNVGCDFLMAIYPQTHQNSLRKRPKIYRSSRSSQTDFHSQDVYDRSLLQLEIFDTCHIGRLFSQTK